MKVPTNGQVAALNSLVTLVAAGQRNRDETVAYLAEMFRGKMARH